MTKEFDRVLSDAELISATFKTETEGTMGELRAVEQAVLAKIAEQEPIGYLHANELSYIDAKSGTKEELYAYDYTIPLYAASLLQTHTKQPLEMVPEGFQIVPKEPTVNQIVSAMDASLLGRPSPDDETYVMSIIEAYLSAAPKFGDWK